MARAMLCRDPEHRKYYKSHHDWGFDVISISVDRDRGGSWSRRDRPSVARPLGWRGEGIEGPE